MTIFAVTYQYSNDVATRDNLRTEHRDYLRQLADHGLLLVSGPYGPDEAPGALLLFHAPTSPRSSPSSRTTPSPLAG